MKRFTILVVDDDEQILDFLRPKLRGAGYNVLTAGNGIEALEQAKDHEPDLLVLDLAMPEKDGLETLKEIRDFSAMPVIILSARGADADKIKGLEMGADDYLSKPFNPDELLARIRALRRRFEPAETRKTLKPLSFEDLTVDFDKRLVVVGGEEKQLTNIEWLLLSELARNAGRLVTYHHLLTTVWGAEYHDDIQLVRSWISRLRHKIEKDPDNPKLIRNLPKAGYIMNQPSS
ncbi:MAG: response regulator transcription factor [Dehalococcoidales bacterium]|nr:response regulator transcription factor [Dehalococcoidales bacterium]